MPIASNHDKNSYVKNSIQPPQKNRKMSNKTIHIHLDEPVSTKLCGSLRAHCSQEKREEEVNTSRKKIMSTRENLVDVVGESEQQSDLKVSASDLQAMIFAIENGILPLTAAGVSKGNKVFGAAVLNPDFSISHAGTNTETECPLFHGEVKVILDWSKKTPAASRGPTAKAAVFLATHEPCCMCISSIVWSGFQKVFYFFPYSITKAQGISHDINTMHELWGVESYRKRNKYIATACIIDLIEDLDDSIPEKKVLQASVEKLRAEYDVLSRKYHSEKGSNTENSLVLD